MCSRSMITQWNERCNPARLQFLTVACIGRHANSAQMGWRITYNVNDEARLISRLEPVVQPGGGPNDETPVTAGIGADDTAGGLYGSARHCSKQRLDSRIL